MSIEPDRVLSSSTQSREEESVDRALRPKKLSDYVGQHDMRQQLEISIAAARKRREPLDHVLIFGPPGLGKTTIAKIIAKKIPVSIELGLLAQAFALALGIPLGIAMAKSTRSRFKIWDKFGTVLIVIIEAVPSAVYHLLIQLYGSEWLGVPMLFDESKWYTWILPVFSLSIGSIVYYAMWLRRYMVDEANKDYIRLARAKGVPEGKISRVHVFRNAFVPLIQYIPNSILFTLMGSLYVESLYSIPGMGGLLVQVIKIQDNTMVEALVVIYSALSVVGLLLGDIMMAIFDPRISFTTKEGSRA